MAYPHASFKEESKAEENIEFPAWRLGHDLHETEVSPCDDILRQLTGNTEKAGVCGQQHAMVTARLELRFL